VSQSYILIVGEPTDVGIDALKLYGPYDDESLAIEEAQETLALQPDDHWWVCKLLDPPRNPKPRNCPHCGIQFDAARKARGVNRVYCTEACKAKAYRLRLKEKK
jgi:hypothetical protein